MKKIGKYMLVLFLVMGLVLSVTACGQQGESTEGDKEDAKGEPQEEVVLKVGTEPTFPPFEVLDPKTDKIMGFDIDLIEAIAAESGYKVEVQDLGFDALIPALQSGTIDIIASGMTITDERKEQIDFTAPYINAGLALAVAEGNTDINSVEDLKGKKVSVQIGTTGAIKAEELKEQGIVKEVKIYDTVDVVMAEVARGTVDASINDLPVTLEYINKGHTEIKIVGDPMTSEEYGFAVAKGKEDLLKKLDDGLKKVIESGKYAELLEKYNLPESSQPK